MTNTNYILFFTVINYGTDDFSNGMIIFIHT